MSKVQQKKGSRPSNNQNQSPFRLFLVARKFQVALVLITFCVFGNGIFNQYALDDEFYTAGGNKLTLKGIKGIPEIWTSHTFFNNDGTSYDYRPLALTTFAIETSLVGERPYVSHFISVLLYALTMLVLFRLLQRWFKAQGDWFAFFVCLLFLVHPLHTEVVDNIKCRDEILCHLFALLSILFIWKHIETKEKKYLFLFPVFFVLGVLSKHTIAPYIILIPLSIIFFSDVNWKKALLYAVPLFVLMVLVSRAQQLVLPDSSRHFLTHENPFIDNPPDFLTKLATGSHIVGRYLWLHFIPHPLLYYYGYSHVPVVGWSDPIALISLAVHLFLVWVMIREVRKKTILGFGIAYYLVNIAVYSNVLQPAPGLMAERFTYAASLGFCIAAVAFVFRYFKTEPLDFSWKADAHQKVKWALLAIIVLFSLRSVVRNEDWEDKMVLYGNDMPYLTESAKANMLYGSLLSSRGVASRLESNQLMQQGKKAEAQIRARESQEFLIEARACFDKAVSVFPNYPTAWSNWGTTFFFLNDFASAKPLFKKSITLKKDYTEGYFNLGMTYDNLKNSDSAEWCYRQAIRTDSMYVQAYDQLTKILAIERRVDEGYKLAKILDRKFPGTDKPLMCLSTIQLADGDTVAAAATLEEAARRNPSNMQRLQNLVNYFKRAGNEEKASYYYSLLLQQQAQQQKEERKRNKR
ncbi:MAG: glycosyltransferase family 39 protein [Bacteroidia bacterium]